MNYFRYLGTIGAFILFIIAIKFFNDGNMYWWLFMFAFIIVSGFLVNRDEMSCKHGKIWQSPDGELGMEECDKCNENMNKWMKPIMDNLSKHKMADSWYDDAHCMECGYVNKACVCKPVSNKLPKDWEDYKATYVEDVGDDGIIDNIDDGVADGLEMDSETNYLNNAMTNRDAEIKYKTDVHSMLCGCDDCLKW